MPNGLLEPTMLKRKEMDVCMGQRKGAISSEQAPRHFPRSVNISLCRIFQYSLRYVTVSSRNVHDAAELATQVTTVSAPRSS